MLFVLLTTSLGCDFFIPIPADFVVRESVEQLHVLGAEPGAELAVYDERRRVVADGTADDLGSLIFRGLEPGLDYGVGERRGRLRQISAPHRVMSVEESQPDPSFYSDQTLEPGFNYITTRDGTTLSAYVYLPGPPENGPYPTLVGYSGYQPSKPGAPLDLPPEVGPIVALLCAGALPVLCDAPNHPAGLIGGLFGYATVGVNIRGTGCSGGAFDYFETLQVLDGYDVIETIAAQDWVLHNEVGMAGLSYPGISQLFVAQSRPPSLASITPLSVVAETTSSTLAPGGIFNDGFAFEWANAVLNGARPYGQGWEAAQVEREAAEGVTTCADNQVLHSQAVDAIQKALDNPYYDPEIADPVNPTTFVDQIDVPVFLTGAWQDEQTGAHFATLLDDFTAAPVKRFTVFNGLHADGYAPQILAEWKAFNDIYVAREVPNLDPLIFAISGLLFEDIFGHPLQIPAIPFSGEASYEAARQAFEAQDELRVIFESGAAPELYPQDENDSGGLGSPVGTFDVFFEAWPPPETEPLRLFLNADGSLRAHTPVEARSSSAFDHDPAAGQRTLGGSQPFYEWAPTPDGKAVVFVSDPLDEDTVMLGSGSVDLWIQSTERDADLEVLLSEVRDDGQEVYVQAGWLRASHRALSEEATELRPVKTHLESDARPLRRRGWTQARVEIFPFGHIFRAGSRIRLQIDTPGDSRERWRFMLLEYDDEATHYVAHSDRYPSSVLLPVIPGIEPPTDPAPCPSLRGQPCRSFEPYLNRLEDPPKPELPGGGYPGHGHVGGDWHDLLAQLLAWIGRG
jgi:predicted acyl esterase